MKINQQMPAFKMSSAEDIAKLMVSHIIDPKNRSDAYKRHVKSMWRNKTEEKSKWTKSGGWEGSDDFDKTAPKLHYNIDPLKKKINIPRGSPKNWAKIFIIEGAFETASVFSAGFTKLIYSLEHNRDSYYKHYMAMTDDLEAQKEESFVKIFKVCMELEKNNAPKGLKDVMVKSKKSDSPVSLGSFFNYTSVTDKWDESALGLMFNEYNTLIEKGENKKAEKRNKQEKALAEKWRRIQYLKSRRPAPKIKKVIIKHSTCL